MVHNFLHIQDCKDRYFKSGKRERGHIPFRDKASQSLMKKMQERQAEGEVEEIGSQGGQSHGTQEEPEQEPDLADGTAQCEEAEVDEDDSADEKQAMDVDQDVDGPPETTYPTLEAYQAKWDRSLKQHSKSVPGDFSHTNLVPQCVTNHCLNKEYPYTPCVESKYFFIPNPTPAFSLGWPSLG